MPQNLWRNLYSRLARCDAFQAADVKGVPSDRHVISHYVRQHAVISPFIVVHLIYFAQSGCTKLWP